MATRVTRRRFLSLILALPAACSVAIGLSGKNAGQANAARAATSSASAEAVELAPEDLVAGGAEGVVIEDGVVALEGVGAGLLYTKDIKAPFPFQFVGVHWAMSEGGYNGVTVAIQTSADGEEWTPWTFTSIDSGQDELDRALFHSTLVGTPDLASHRYARCLIRLWEGAISAFSLTFVEASPPVLSGTLPSAGSLQGMFTAAGVGKPPVISRTAWGCPDGQGSPLWPAEYAPVTHFIIHHTVTQNSTRTDQAYWANWVLAIWQYHYSRRDSPEEPPWGDIGYNYLIDPAGRIYEGRAGGDGVVGAHTGMFNRGSMGIAFLGNFSNGEVQPTPEAILAAQRLIAWMCDQRGIWPDEKANIVARRVYYGCGDITVNVPRVAGHRDYAGNNCPGKWDPNSTDCPGGYLHPAVAAIRSGAADMVRGSKYSVSLNNVSITPGLVAVGESLRFSVTVTNTGGVTLKRGYPDPGHTYEEGQVAQGASYDTFRVGLDYAGRPDSMGAYPYRWGLGKDLAPGESVTITGYVRIKNTAERNFWAGAMREGIAFVADHVGTTSIVSRVRRGDVCLANVAVRPSGLAFTEGLIEVVAEVENWTGETVPTQGPAPGYVYEEGEVCPPDEKGCYRIGLDYDGRPGHVKDHPYRWGLGTVPARSIRQVRGYVRLKNPAGQRNYWVGLVREGVAWYEDYLAITGVRVQVPAARIRLPLIHK